MLWKFKQDDKITKLNSNIRESRGKQKSRPGGF